MRRSSVLVFLLVLSLLVGGGALGLKVRADRAEAAAARDRREALAVATQWLRAWQDGRYADLDALTAGDAPSGALQRQDQRLQASGRVLRPGELSPAGDEVPYTATLALDGLGPLTWTSRVRVREVAGRWAVAFDAPTAHPALRNGLRLDRRSRPAPRGAVLDRAGRPLRAASADLAGNVLGRPPTAGRPATGLERVLGQRLAGFAAGSVVLANASSGEAVRELKRYEGTAAKPVRTSLDLDVQRAAERALAGLPSPAALVAIDAATGQVRASASRPLAGKPRAFTSYAPGSVFKVVTAAALLDSGLRPGSRVDCPATYRGTGNASSVRPGPTTLVGAFAQSCNTAFLQLAEGLPTGALARMARRLGFEQELLEIRTDRGTFPQGGGSADATAAIGQGRVEASPLLVASVLASVQSGVVRRPTLLLSPAQAGTPLPAAVVGPLRAMLRAAVETGTGTTADLPGAAVSGKTGSAQVGTRGQVHAWFAGYRGGLAFCVFVESGASGGATAAPVAARFLRALG